MSLNKREYMKWRKGVEASKLKGQSSCPFIVASWSYDIRYYMLQKPQPFLEHNQVAGRDDAGLGVLVSANNVSHPLICGCSSLGFSDDGYLQYYVTPRSGGKKKKGLKMVTVKKRLKLIKGLSRDLSMFYGMGFGVETEDGLIGEVKGKMILEATKILLAQLQQLRVEEKDLNKKRKEEKAKLKATRMKACESSSSNSESSDSECGEIEVCMDGKCKKSGAATLLEEFERRVGVDGAVVACKCMGKCRDGPNVRVLNGCDGIQAEGGDGSFVLPANPLCIGVGMEDVSTVVANFFGEERKDLGLMAAA
ncbi:hypothetical protein HHK36_015489 [Tetracentron sinense]|uniref:Uncharacterized protein n=1 Tax=Tetracentron sinense TaxID=13715 RepID=A0A834Z355_TETSI|nr:hypothetical protein HHK36_015489 [Tetracentron sinense]